MSRLPFFGLPALVLAALLAPLACSDSPLGLPPLEVGDSRAYSIWEPTGPDTCTREIHDSYSIVGPDGLRYPTWHPPVDPGTGCTFGHEHGRDPRGSDLYGEVGAIPFGYANQQLDLGTFGASRHEDHVGHKVEWENDVEMRIGDGGGNGPGRALRYPDQDAPGIALRGRVHEQHA